MFRRTAGLLAVLFASPLFAAEPRDFPFHAGDRVLFLGDSITDQYQYSTYIELYLTTRSPKGNMTFHNAGIGGDTAGGGARRFANHVLAEKPTIVTIDFGMNDGGYGGFDPKRAEQYVKFTEQMLTMAKKAGVRVALISPNAVEVRSNPKQQTYLETQAKFYAPLKDLAAKHDVPFVDQYAVTKNVLEKIAADDAPVKPFPDGVHTSVAGGLLMAHTILAGMHAPAIVSFVEVDTAKNEWTGSRCTFKNQTASADRVTFDRIDDTIPLPLLKEWRDLLPYVKNLADLNVYGLKITGLKAGKYDVTIDGQSVGTFTADQLAADVNLGNAGKGPIHDQGMKVLAAINAKNALVKNRFWQVVMFEPRSVPEWLGMPTAVVAEKRRDELVKRDEQIAEKQAEVYRLAAPVAHKWEVKPAE
jgi:lysophospholipase L1-like esterase